MIVSRIYYLLTYLLSLGKKRTVAAPGRKSNPQYTAHLAYCLLQTLHGVIPVQTSVARHFSRVIHVLSDSFNFYTTVSFKTSDAKTTIERDKTSEEILCRQYMWTM